jgi:hypothetical protein
MTPASAPARWAGIAPVTKIPGLAIRGMRKSFGPTLVLVTAVATLLTGWVSYAREATATDVVALVSLLWIGGRIAQSALSSEPFLRPEMYGCCRYRTRPSGPVNICDDEPAAGREWVPAFYEAVGAPTPAGSSSDARRPWARGADNHHARTHLAWSPCFPSWRQGFHAIRSGSHASEASR